MKRIPYLVGCGVLTLASVLQADLPVVDIAGDISAADTAARTLLMVNHEVEMLKYELRNIQNLPGQHYANAMMALQQLSTTIQIGDAVTYASGNLQQAWQQTFPGYQNDDAINHYDMAVKKWQQADSNTQQGTLAQLHQTFMQYKQEASTITGFVQQAHGVQGRMQALQLGNEIAAEQLAMEQKTRATQMAAANAEAVHASTEIEEKVAAQQSINAVIKNPDDSSQYQSYKENQNFGLIPSFNT